MPDPTAPPCFDRPLTRRDALGLMARAGSALALPGLLAGCAVDPVTGRRALVGMDEAEEVAVDRAQSPHQFSADYGAVQDKTLNDYVDGIARTIGRQSHRPQMPFTARVLNANYVNAYAFPGGSIGVTRGIVLELDDEDQLAALIGHEVGHVNARHAAEQAGRQMIAGVAAAVGQVALAASDQAQLAPVVGFVEQLGASALLARYSRDDEREADTLGRQYMQKTGHHPQGMVDLMAVLERQSQAERGLLDTMFASHPMSHERYETARRAAESAARRPRDPKMRTRFQDHTAALRRLAPAIARQQAAQKLAQGNRLQAAEDEMTQALQLAPNDYTGLVLMAKLQLAQKDYAAADRYLDKARAVYPDEGQAQHLAGLTELARNRPEAAMARFADYERLLPGHPNTAFLMGIASERMGQRRAAAEQFDRYLRSGAQDDQARYAYRRLQSWGYVR